jgi:hypothetical protein
MVETQLFFPNFVILFSIIPTAISNLADEFQSTHLNLTDHHDSDSQTLIPRRPGYKKQNNIRYPENKPFPSNHSYLWLFGNGVR